MDGNPRQSRELVSHLDFDFTIQSIGKYFKIILPNKTKNQIRSIFIWKYDLTFLCICLSNCGLVCLPDSILAFHKNGMQGRSLKNGEITQEISDLSRTYRLLGSDKYVKYFNISTIDLMTLFFILFIILKMFFFCSVFTGLWL